MREALRSDLLLMGRVVLWLAFLALATPVAAVIVHAMARVVCGVNLD